jgi:HPt (histidine-containing phosphotransfer) domain-containing protein
MTMTRGSTPGRATVLDESQLDAHRARRPGFLERIIIAYMEEAPKYIKGLKTAVASKDRPKLKMAAHTFKSSSYNVGGVALAELCQQLEIASENAEADGNLIEMVNRIGGAYFEVEEALKGVLLELRKPTV